MTDESSRFPYVCYNCKARTPHPGLCDTCRENPPKSDDLLADIDNLLDTREQHGHYWTNEMMQAIYRDEANWDVEQANSVLLLLFLEVRMLQRTMNQTLTLLKGINLTMP